MYKCKFTCDLCGNHIEQDCHDVPDNWWKIILKGRGSDPVITMVICRICLPKPVHKSGFAEIMQFVRKKIANLLN